MSDPLESSPNHPADANHLDGASSDVRSTDSPWLWLAIFVIGALAALYLTMPKYRWRQPQIERQFQARERSGHAVSADGGFSPLSSTNSTMLTLRPLFIFFVAALFLLTMVFWGRRLFLIGKGPRDAATRPSINASDQDGG